MEGLYGSDYFPIILKNLQPFYDDRLPHWKINQIGQNLKLSANKNLYKTQTTKT